MNRRRARFPLVAALAAILLSPAAGARADAPPRLPLRVGTSGDYPPFSLARRAEAAGSWAGFDIDVATRFAADRGSLVEFVPFHWAELGRDVAAGRFDVAMSGVTVRADRSLLGRFSVPVATTHAVALTWNGSGAATLEELDKPQRRIAVNAGGHLQKVAEASFRRAHVVALADNDAVHMALQDRAFDAVVTEDIEAARWAAGVEGIVRLGPLTNDRKAYLLPPDRRRLAMRLDLWLLAREADGTLDDLRRRHFVVAGSGGTHLGPGRPAAGLHRAAEPYDALAAAILERLALMPMVFEAKRRAGLPVEDTERERAVLEAAVEATREASALRAAMPARRGSPAGAGPRLPDEGQVRFLFQAMMETAKDAQRRLTESGGRASTRGRPASARPGNIASAGAGLDADTTPAEARRLLEDTLRPAIGRVTDRIACILVSMDEKVSVEESSRRLAALLGSQGIHPRRIEAMASAVARLSSAEAVR